MSDNVKQQREELKKLESRSKLEGWKDEWIRNWIANTDDSDVKKFPWENKGCKPLNRTWLRKSGYFKINGSTTESYKMRKYSPARCKDKRVVRNQLVSRVIWQTWKSTIVDGKQFKLMTNLILLNPDYEYIMFTYDDCSRFICKFFDERVQRAYGLLKPGAGKSDIWRLAIILRYGGIYVDSDSVASDSFSHLINPKASVVSGIGAYKNDLHQWVLAYTPNHPFIRQALYAIVNAVLESYKARKYMNTIYLTGPGRFYLEGVEPILRRNNCTISKRDAVKYNLELVKERHPCSKVDKPEKIGIVQLFNADNFNNLFINIKKYDIDRHDQIPSFEQQFNDFSKISRECLKLK